MNPDNPLAPELPRVSDYTRWYATHTPDAEAVVCNDQRITYRELEAQIDALARALLAADIEPGDRVASLATPSPDYLVSFLASARIGLPTAARRRQISLPSLPVAPAIRFIVSLLS